MTPRTERLGRGSAPVRPARALRRRFIPPQHGAWAMLIVPYLVGVTLAGTTWVDIPLGGAWLVGYLLSYYVFQALKSRRPGRFRAQMLVYGAVALPLLVVVVLARPAVLWYAPVYAVLLLISAWYAWQRRERALGNDLVAVLQSCLMVLVAATVAGERPTEVAGAFAMCLAYFGGTAFYVKTMIRERGNLSYRRWSVVYHLVTFALSAWFSPVLAGLFGWLLVRAWLLPRYRLAPLQVGIIEIGNSVLLFVALLITWA